MDRIDERTLRYARNLTARLQEPNRQTAEKYILLKTNAGLAASSVYNIAKAMAFLGEQIGTRPFKETSADDLLALVERLRRFHRPHTIGQSCVLLLRFLKDQLDTDALPRPMRMALTVKLPRTASTKQPVTADEWVTLLEASRYTRPAPTQLRLQAILWTLRFSGLRASELVSLNVGGVQFTKDGGAFLQLPADGARLKTGPRRPYVLECVPALRAWLAVHPRLGDLAAPLFPSVRAGPECNRTTYHAVLIQIQKLSKKAGLRTISPHLFRHARATDMARNRWTETNATKQMGWTITSKMWNHYSHLTDDDLVSQVRRDAGIDDTGNPTASERICPACAEPVRAAANKCKHCGEWFNPKQKRSPWTGPSP